MHSPTPPRPPRKALLLLLFVLGIRGLFVPLHLVHEDHLSSAAQLLAHSTTDREHAEPEHDHEDHPAHPAAEHATDFLVQRTSCPQATANSLALATVAVPKLLLPRPSAWTEARPAPPPPDEQPLTALRLRGPPAAS